MKRVFLDANVLFTAAHNENGKAALVIDLGKRGRFGLLTSEYAIAEAIHNLVIKSPESVAAFDGLLRHFEVVNPALSIPCPIELAQKDQPIFVAAMTGRAIHLLTGDLRDFGHHMNKPKHTEGILVQTVADFLNSL